MNKNNPLLHISVSAYMRIQKTVFHFFHSLSQSDCGIIPFMKTLFTFLLAAGCAEAAVLPKSHPLHDLAERVTPGMREKVAFDLIPEAEAIAVAKGSDTLVRVSAPDVNRLAAGYGIYLRDAAGLHWSWCGSRFEPFTPAAPEKPIEKSIPWKWRQAYNYCTLSYTMAFWDKPQWSEEVDRLALFGINMPLVQAGLEKVWQLTLRELGYPEEKIFAFIPNPSAAAWWNMGNLEGYGGPLTQAEIDNEAALGRFIVERARGLGMKPILQGFVGLVPSDLGDYLPGNYIPQGMWSYGSKIGFQRPAVLDPTSDLFKRVAAVWYKNLQAVYGDIPEACPFGGDLFHEGGRTNGLDVSDCAAAVQAAMQEANPGAIWVIQAWCGNPTPALLKKLNPEHTLIELLRRDQSPNWLRAEDYGDIPWIWCELLNFGGRPGLYGSLRQCAEFGRVQTLPAARTMQGLGLLSEGFETNPAYYDLFLQRIAMPRDRIIEGAEFKAWIADYLRCRYGFLNDDLLRAFLLLEETVYRPVREQDGPRETLFCATPSLNASKVSHWGNGSIYYDTANVREALELYLKTLEANPDLAKLDTFRFDILDLTRQVVYDLDKPLLAVIGDALRSQDKASYQKAALLFGILITLDDLTQKYDPFYTLDRQYERARAKARPASNAAPWLLAAKRLYTTWTVKAGLLNGYAFRPYAGLLRGYYLHRWRLFFKACEPALDDPAALETCLKKAKEKIAAFDENWDGIIAKPKKGNPEELLDRVSLILFELRYIEELLLPKLPEGTPLTPCAPPSKAPAEPIPAA